MNPHPSNDHGNPERIGRPANGRLTFTWALVVLALGISHARGESRRSPVVEAVQRVRASVVNIHSERTVMGPASEELFALAPSQNRINGMGTGVLLDPRGYIVTNQHVVERAADLKIQVTTNDSKTYKANYITGNDKTDLAFIKIDAKTAFAFINLDDISPNLLGETVIVVGNAVGYGSSISRGVLSAVKRDITIDNVEYKDLVQTDAAINPGNSGGPVIDLSARLVGISSAKMAFTPQGIPTQGLGFAIPSSTISRELSSLVTSGKYALHPSLGIEGVGMTYQLAKTTGSSLTYGVLVEKVVSGSAADKAGIQGGTRTVTVEGSSYTLGGDIIVSVNGVKVVDFDSLASYLEGNAIAGQTVQMGIIRSGSMMTLSVTLGSLPSP